MYIVKQFEWNLNENLSVFLRSVPLSQPSTCCMLSWRRSTDWPATLWPCTRDRRRPWSPKSATSCSTSTSREPQRSTESLTPEPSIRKPSRYGAVRASQAAGLHLELAEQHLDSLRLRVKSGHCAGLEKNLFQRKHYCSQVQAGNTENFFHIMFGNFPATLRLQTCCLSNETHLQHF